MAAFLGIFIFAFIFIMMIGIFGSAASNVNNIKEIQRAIKREISTDENGKVTVTTTTVTTQDKDCVNDFDNTCEHAHLSNDIKADKRYDVDSDIIVGSHGPIDTDTYDSPIRKE